MAEQQESSFQQWRWIIGVGLAATGSLISNLGVNLQKLTHVRNQKAKSRNPAQTNKAHASPAVVPQSPSLSSASTNSDESPPTRVSYWKQPLWALGLSLVVLGSIADFVALGFAAQSVVAPLGSLTLVSNVIFAPYFSGESASRHDLIATAAILLGSGTAVAFASHESDAVSFEVLFAYFTTLRFVLYAIFMTVFIAGMYYAMKTIEELAVAAEHSQQKAAEYRRVSKFHRFAYGAAAGAVGAQSVLFAKSTSELVHEGFLSMFERYESYLIFFGLASTIFLQIKWLNQGLQRFDALYMVPVFQAFWIVFSVISGLIVYDESKDMSQLNAFFFTLGVLVTVCGVYSLSQRAESHHHQLADANHHQHGRRNSDIHVGLIHSDRPEQEFSALASRDLDSEFEGTARDVELGDLSLPEEDQLNEEEEERLQMIAKSITTNSSASVPAMTHPQIPRHSPTARDSAATTSTSSAHSLSPRLTSPLSVDSYADGSSEISSTLSGHLDHHHLPPSRVAGNRRSSPTQDLFGVASPVANGSNS